MSDQRNGGIAWTEETWNPLRGCTRVSQGCMNCYAESMAARFCGAGQPYEGTINPETKRWNGTIKLVPEKLAEPLRWQRPRMVFVNSMSDLFHEDVPDWHIDKVFAVMAMAERQTFQVLTKRPARMKEYLSKDRRPEWADSAVSMWGENDPDAIHDSIWHGDATLPNVWLGVTVENQEAADERIPLLLETPASVRWASMEPLLGPVDLALFGTLPRMHHIDPTAKVRDLLHWVVVGGESGPHARPMHPDWARSLRDQCAAAGVPFLFKQWGEFSLDYDRDRDDPDYRKCNLMDKKPGRWINLAGGHGFHGDRVHYAERVGKKSAGRLLDGKLHNGYPEVRK